MYENEKESCECVHACVCKCENDGGERGGEEGVIYDVKNVNTSKEEKK